jgi:hypothetical protein
MMLSLTSILFDLPATCTLPPLSLRSNNETIKKPSQISSERLRSDVEQLRSDSEAIAIRNSSDIAVIPKRSQYNFEAIAQ